MIVFNPKRSTLSSLLVAVVSALVSFDGRADERYYGANPIDNAALDLTGITDGTSIVLSNIETGDIITTSNIDRFETLTIELSTTRYFVIESDAPILAHLGYDCCAVGGSTFLPTIDGHSRVGRSFVSYFPVLGVQSDVVIFAQEDAHVVIAEPDGDILAHRRIPSGMEWNAYPLVGATPYTIVSTGDIAIMLSAVNGLTTVPPLGRSESCGSDVGRNFLLATHSWGTGGIAVFAYEDAEIEISPIGGGTSMNQSTLAQGEWLFLNETGRRSYRVISTGDIAVWAGDMEGGSEIGDLGDDFSFNLGQGGMEFYFHTLNLGAFIVAPDESNLVIDGVEYYLGAGEHVELPPGIATHLVGDSPVIAMVYGGNTLNDWGGYLLPAPSQLRDPDVICPAQIPEVPPWPTEDASPDADADADADLDQQEEQDASQFDADITAPLGPRETCDCHLVGARQHPGIIPLIISFPF